MLTEHGPKHFCKLLHFALAAATAAAASAVSRHETKSVCRCCERTPFVCTTFCLFCSHFEAFCFRLTRTTCKIIHTLHLSTSIRLPNAHTAHSTQCELISHGDIYGLLARTLSLFPFRMHRINIGRQQRQYKLTKIAKQILKER